MPKVPASIEDLFARYARTMNEALAGKPDLDATAALYAPEFVSATPAGVMTGKNDEALRRAMAGGYAHYRAIGTKEMLVGKLEVSPLDDMHCVAHVGWTARYARPGRPDVTIDFTVHYLVRTEGGAARVFGWVAGDEQALLAEHGIV